MKVVTCSPGMRGFDTATKLTFSVDALAAAEAKFVIRYVSHGAPEDRDLTAIESAMILGAGLGLMVVMHPPKPGWVPSLDLGLQHARAAMTNLSDVFSYPGNMTVWCDLEGVAVGTAAAEITGYVNGWSTVVGDFGYQPGLYVGFDSGLTGSQLYRNLTLTRYWKSASDVPVPLPRGWCMAQTLGPSIGGIDVDYDEVVMDARGGLPKMLVAG